MTVSLPRRLEQQIHDLIRAGAYPNVQSLLAEAVNALIRDRERQQIERTLEEHGMDQRRIEELLKEAEASGEYTEITPQDWADIEREGLALAQARKSA